MLIECQNCAFYLSENEKFCLNCGYPATGFVPESLSDEAVSNFNLAFSCLTALIAGGIYVYVNSFDFKNLPYLTFFLILGFLLGALIFPFYAMIANNRLAKEDFQRRDSFADNPRTLGYREEIILQKSLELEEELRNIEHLQAENKTLPNERAGRQLTEARESVLTQIALCELQKERISIIRMQNNLLPLLYESDNFRSQTAINEINAALRKLKSIRLSLTNDYAIEFPKESLKEKEIFLGEMERTAESLFKLRDNIIQYQAANSLENSQNTPIDQSSTDLTHMIESFNIQTSLTEFDNSYKRLEKNYLIKN